MTADMAVRSDNGAVPPEIADLSAIERVIVAGDLSKLTQEERWDYYQGVCRSVGLNPFTQPFAYLTLNGKLQLYALKGATDQLRGKHGISISPPKVEITDGLCIVTVTATGRDGRTDSDLGIVAIENLRGDAKANGILKAITKSKRRVTLSFCGLGMLDETEIETIPNARVGMAEVLETTVAETPTMIVEAPGWLDAPAAEAAPVAAPPTDQEIVEWSDRGFLAELNRGALIALGQMLRIECDRLALTDLPKLSGKPTDAQLRGAVEQVLGRILAARGLGAADERF